MACIGRGWGEQRLHRVSEMACIGRGVGGGETTPSL